MRKHRQRPITLETVVVIVDNSKPKLDLLMHADTAETLFQHGEICWDKWNLTYKLISPRDHYKFLGLNIS